jgi:hypothetical protein
MEQFGPQFAQSLLEFRHLIQQLTPFVEILDPLGQLPEHRNQPQHPISAVHFLVIRHPSRAASRGWSDPRM